MIYSDCPLYFLKSKKRLKYLLHINDDKLFEQAFICNLITPYIDTKKHSRLIEPPKPDLKIIQHRIKVMLGKINVPNNIFSGVKGRSYVDNAQLHSGVRYLYKVDLTAFFPSIKRNTVYNFFYNDLQCSPDVSEILTNLTTVNLLKTTSSDTNTIADFMKAKGIRSFNHLISGSPTSQILSYLVNKSMFDELQNLSNENRVTMSVYVDDLTFSSSTKISYRFKSQIHKTIKKYDYRVSTHKVKSYSKRYPKLVTGVVIDSNGNLVIKNSLRYKIIEELGLQKKRQNTHLDVNRLRGLVTAARQVSPHSFPSVRAFAFTKIDSTN